MAITTQVRSAGNRINLAAWCMGGVFMSAICAYGLDHLTAFSSALVAAMLLFANMILEKLFCSPFSC